MKNRKYQVVARIIKDLCKGWIDEEVVFGPCPNEEGAVSVLAALAGREDVLAARIELVPEEPCGCGMGCVPEKTY